MPAFNPDDDREPLSKPWPSPGRIAAADALAFCTPEYAGRRCHHASP